jgi:hypothetical protein
MFFTRKLAAKVGELQICSIVESITSFFVYAIIPKAICKTIVTNIKNIYVRIYRPFPERAPRQPINETTVTKTPMTIMNALKSAKEPNDENLSNNALPKATNAIPTS